MISLGLYLCQSQRRKASVTNDVYSKCLVFSFLTRQETQKNATFVGNENERFEWTPDINPHQSHSLRTS